LAGLPCNRDEVDLRKIFLEMTGIEGCAVTADVDRNLAFPFCRLDGRLPFFLPARFDFAVRSRRQ
jgi:hypothetical protein